MIFEALQHFFYPAPKYVKAMGYLREIIAIEARYQRCSHHWMPHLNKCKKVITENASNLEAGDHVLILGSGGFHDIPANALLEMNLKVTCVDIFHLPNIRKQFPQITFIERDLTGLAKPLYENRAEKSFNPESYTSDWCPEEKPDLVISLNLVSQLPMALTSFANAENILLPENFETEIKHAHVKWLKSICQNQLIITDIKRNYLHKGELIKSDPALTEEDYELLGSPQEQWIWNIAPVGETEKDVGIEHVVGVWKSQSNVFHPMWSKNTYHE